MSEKIVRKVGYNPLILIFTNAITDYIIIIPVVRFITLKRLLFVFSTGGIALLFNVFLFIIELTQKPILISILKIILDCFRNQKLDWSLKLRDPKKQILSFGIGSLDA